MWWLDHSNKILLPDKKQKYLRTSSISLYWHLIDFVCSCNKRKKNTVKALSFMSNLWIIAASCVYMIVCMSWGEQDLSLLANASGSESRKKRRLGSNVSVIMRYLINLYCMCEAIYFGLEYKKDHMFLKSLYNAFRNFPLVCYIAMFLCFMQNVCIMMNHKVSSKGTYSPLRILPETPHLKSKFLFSFLFISPRNSIAWHLSTS